MQEIIERALLIPYFPAIFISSTIFLTFLGFIYGFTMSYVNGIKRTLIFGFFVVVLATILVLLFSGGFLVVNQCSNETAIQNCDLNEISRVSFSLMLVLVHLFFNLIVGHLGLFLGVGLYFPSELYLRKFKFISNLKKDTEEFNQLSIDSKTRTTGTIKIPDTKNVTNLQQ